jgi:hypothetical protein
METSSKLTLRFRLVDSEDDRLNQSASASELSDFFRLANDTTRAVILNEAEQLVDSTDLPSMERLEVKGQLAKRSTTLARATQASEIRSGSVVIDLLVDPLRLAEAVLVVGSWTLARTADAIWERSPIRDQVARWADRAFGRSREAAEHALSSSTVQRLSVAPREVVEETTDGRHVIEITIIRLPLDKPGDWERAARILGDTRLF